jgi:RHS repeat-associated protein
MERIMNKLFSLLMIFSLALFQAHCAENMALLTSTESDPDCIIKNCMNVLTGDYCESATDLVVQGPDSFILQRFYNSKNYVTGQHTGGWRILPQTLLIVGNDLNNKSRKIGQDQFNWTYAFSGERSGGILTYSGWRRSDGFTRDPLKIDIFKDALGMVNTYAKELNGQTNHLNNLLTINSELCELVLGDGTKRFYKKVEKAPSTIFQENIAPHLAEKVSNAQYYLLMQETLPSGNHFFYTYNEDGNIESIEMKNRLQDKIFGWLKFGYHSTDDHYLVKISASNEKTLEYQFSNYHLANGSQTWALTKVIGSHLLSCHYEYQVNHDYCQLVKKTLPENLFLEIGYDSNSRVAALSEPHPDSGSSLITTTFEYGDAQTLVKNIYGLKTTYRFDQRSQLTAIEQYNKQGELYRVDRKYWGKGRGDTGLLLARSIEDRASNILSYRSFEYDRNYNITEERLYGNLTGKEGISLKIDEKNELLDPESYECHVKTFEYSKDGYNLLTMMGDSKNNKTTYEYQPGTNLLTKKLIYDKHIISRRTFQHYNEDGVLIKIIEDDGFEENENKFYGGMTQKYITELTPKASLPGVGLPEIIESKCFDFKLKQEIPIKKIENFFDPQGNLLISNTYGSNGDFAYSKKTAYNFLGQINMECDGDQKEIHYTYDEAGRVKSKEILFESKTLFYHYDHSGNPIKITEKTDDFQIDLLNTYDLLGRKTSSTDPFKNTTHFEYDEFGRLKSITYPSVLDENENAIQPTFFYNYDLFGNVICIIDPKGYKTCKAYNLRGDPIKILYPDGSSELFKYDVEGSLHRSLTREKLLAVYEYDYLGRLTYVEHSKLSDNGDAQYLWPESHAYNAFHCIKDKYGFLSKSYQYSPEGRIIGIAVFDSNKSESHAESRKTELIYDSLGRNIKTKIWFDHGPEDYGFEYVTYDSFDNILEKRVEDAKGNLLLQKCFEYNPKGQCTEEFFYENGNKITTLLTNYNSLGDLIRFKKGNEEIKVEQDYHYQNHLGQSVLKKRITNALGIISEIEYDALGRVVNISKKDQKHLLSYQKILYDALGQKVCEVHEQISEDQNIGSKINRWIYGPNGRLDEEIEAFGSENEKRTQLTYNTFGQLISKKFQDSIPLLFTYTSRGFIEKIETKPSDNKEIKISNYYSYDSHGNITQAKTYQGQTVERTFDAFHQVTEETVQIDGINFTSKYTYDLKGRLKSVKLPDQSSIRYSYDLIFGKKVERIDSQGKILYTHQYDHYDKEGRLLEEVPIGYCGRKEHTYEDGRKKQVESLSYNEYYQHDSTGRLLEINRSGEFYYPESSYTYNGLSQLTSEKTEKAHTFVNDSLDNRLSVNAESLVFNALNQLTSFAENQYTYDQLGHLKTKTIKGQKTTFESNILSQLTSFENPHKSKIDLVYDAYGRVLSIKENYKGKIAKSYLMYVGYDEIGSLNEKKAIKALRIPGLQGDSLSPNSIAIEVNSEIYAPVHDYSGNVIALLNPYNSELIEKYYYTAFGEETILDFNDQLMESFESINPWRFAEKRKIGDLVYFGLRFYDLSMGMWISQDPLGFNEGPNLYSYLHSNPINYIDRYGLAAENQSETNEYLYGEVEKHCFCERHRTCKRGGDIGKTTGHQLPKIRYDEDFEENLCKFNHYDGKNNYGRSTIFDLGKPELENMGIGFINGINTSYAEAQKAVEYISRLAGGCNVHAVYNADHGFFMNLRECELGLNFIATEPVHQLHKMWNNFFDRVSGDAKFLMICHSQGAIHVRNALLDYPPELRDRIIAMPIAPGGYIYQESCAQAIHYRAEAHRDFIPHLDWAGAKRSKETIITLKSQKNASRHDHAFMSPTYVDVLEIGIDNYINSQGRNI